MIISSKKVNLKRGVDMIITNLKLNNIFGFKDFTINFTYPKKIKNDLITNEFLERTNSFNYKKLNVFIGSNATGKTSLIKTIWYLLLFLRHKESTYLKKIVNYSFDKSQIEMDFIDKSSDEYFIYRILINTYNIPDFKIELAINKIKLKNNSTYEKERNNLDSMQLQFFTSLDALNDLNLHLAWNVALPSTEERFNKIRFVNNLNDEEERDYIRILNNVFKTLDPSIIEIRKSKDADNAFVIVHEFNPALIIQDGMDLTTIPLLSSGTKYGFNIANTIFSIKYHMNDIYLIDEQFSYINSDIEEAVLATMVSLLGPDEQLFFTTHNTNILSLSLPIHSFYFFNKTNDNLINVSCASEFENKNNVNIKNLYDNDIFGSAPDLSKIYELGDTNG